MNIYEKMSAVTEAIKRVPKNLTVGTGKYQYKAVAEADILSAVKDAEKEAGIFSYPVAREVIESRAVPKGDEGRESQFVRIETTYRFVNMEKPDEFVEVKGYGDGIDTNDKAPGKAMTYADKYALMKAYKIETGDDLDARPSDDLAGHDAMKIKQRIEQVLTAKMNAGMSQKDIALAIGCKKEEDINTYLSYCGRLVSFEAALRKVQPPQ